MTEHLVTPQWLAARLDRPDVVALDCTWYVPEMNISGRARFEEGHIPGAVYVDLDDISDLASPYINMMCSPETFATVMGGLGIGDETHVVVYNANYVSARLWWMFRHFGHERVSILDGGWQRWKAEGLPVETGPAHPRQPVRFTARAAGDDIVAAERVLSALRSGDAQVVDVRPKGKFDGTEPTGYPGVLPGHMPGAVNIPWQKLFTADAERRFIGADEFAKLLEQNGVDPARPIISTCGSGVTAAILAFHLDRIGMNDWNIYDGSWHEWGQRDDLPKETVNG
jgi:thiosulfate/3-mercaptopyruvate sulfurtransferase